MISFISNEIAIDQVYGSLWETDECNKFLIKSIGNWLQSEGAFTKNDTARIDTNDSVHLSTDIKLEQSFDTCTLPVLHVLLCFLEFLCQFDTRVREYNSLEIDKLAFLKSHIDHWSSVADNNDLGVLVALLNCEAFLGYFFVAGVDTLCQPNDAILLGNLKCSFKCGNGSTILVNFVNVWVLKVTKHFIVHILRRSVHVLQVTLLMHFVDILIKTLTVRNSSVVRVKPCYTKL